MNTDPKAYGDTFADIYDDWYSGISDVEQTVRSVAGLAGDGRVLELGCGTGRLAIPLSAAGLDVVALDVSRSMLLASRAKTGRSGPALVRGDMVDLPLTGEFRVAFCAFNTFFNLATDADQQRCVHEVSRVLSAGGRLCIEAFVPSAEPIRSTFAESSRSDRAGGRVITTSLRQPADQTVRGVHIHLPHRGGRFRYPWIMHYLHPAQLDALCTAHGFELECRWASWAAAAYHEAAERHVSVYRRLESR